MTHYRIQQTTYNNLFLHYSSSKYFLKNNSTRWSRVFANSGSVVSSRRGEPSYSRSPPQLLPPWDETSGRGPRSHFVNGLQGSDASSVGQLLHGLPHIQVILERRMQRRVLSVQSSWTVEYWEMFFPPSGFAPTPTMKSRPGCWHRPTQARSCCDPAGGSTSASRTRSSRRARKTSTAVWSSGSAASGEGMRAEVPRRVHLSQWRPVYFTPRPSMMSYLVRPKLIHLINLSIWRHSSRIHTESYLDITSSSHKWPCRAKRSFRSI